MAESNLPATSQPELFRAEELPAGHELLTIEQDERAGRSTGERLARNRERYMAIVRCLAEGIGIRATARAFKVSPHTIFAIRDREAAAIATEKQELSRLMGRFVRMGVERLNEELDDIPIGQLSVSLGIVSDKKALLDGDPTVRVEERIEVALSPADLRGMLERIKRADPAGQVIDVAPAAEALPPAPVDEQSIDSGPS
ncbi:MAG: hypothetical protein PHE83_18740 [Opitutaceae bacterium]|nr:hypothetical protein [Opitutaceae bacterium]